MIETWRCYPDMPLDQLIREVEESDVELSIDVVHNYLTRVPNPYLPIPGKFQQLRFWHQPALESGPNMVGYEYSNFIRGAVNRIETPADVLDGNLTWFGTVYFPSERAEIGSLRINHNPLIVRDYEKGISTPAEDGRIVFARYQEQFLVSLDTCHELIYFGLKIIELAFRGERAPVGGYHISDSAIKQSEKLAAVISIDLLCAALRLPDFRFINPFINIKSKC